MATKKGTFQDHEGNELRPDLSAQELLDKIKTVDGTGSGLDADLLDGKEASSFAESSHTHSLVGYYNNGFMSSKDKVKLDKFGDGFVVAGNTAQYLSDNTAYEATIEGRDNRALGYMSHVGGRDSFAIGNYSFAHGLRAMAIGYNNFAFGTQVFAAETVKITINKQLSSYNEGDPIFAINEDLTDQNYISVAQNDANTSYFIPFSPGRIFSTPGFLKLKSIDKAGKTFTIDAPSNFNESTFNYIVDIENGFLTKNYPAGVEINSFCAGNYNLSGGRSSAALGSYGYTVSDSSAVIGFSNRITKDFPRAAIAVGSANDETITGQFVVGIGTGSTRSNGFRVDTTGKGYFKNGSQTNGADFAEFFEWSDGNSSDDDRRGLLVTLEGKKIRPATSDDDFILGVISGRPAIVGNSYDEEWACKFVTDVYGTPVISKHMEPAEYDENGNLIREARGFDWYTINPEYRQDEKYIPRSERPEWGLVGLQGQLVVTDDGTCQPGGYCLPGCDGVATATTDKRGYRVMERKDETHVLVYVHGRIVL